MATISVVSQTSSSVTCKIVDIDISRYFKIQWAILDEQSNAAFGDILYLTDSTHTYTFYNLSTGVQYMIACRLYFTDVACDIVLGDYITLSGSESTYNIYIGSNNYSYGTALALEASATPGATVYIDATANPGCRFTGWSSYPLVQFENPSAESTYFIMPSSDVTITANFAVATQTRPAKFSWTTGRDPSFSGFLVKVSGTAFDLTADEWNGLCNNVNLVGAYATGRTYNFATAYKGNPFYASMYNEVANAIMAITNYSVKLPTVNPGDGIKADDLNQLMYAINSVT